MLPNNRERRNSTSIFSPDNIRRGRGLMIEAIDTSEENAQNNISVTYAVSERTHASDIYPRDRLGRNPRVQPDISTHPELNTTDSVPVVAAAAATTTAVPIVPPLLLSRLANVINSDRDNSANVSFSYSPTRTFADPTVSQQPILANTNTTRRQNETSLNVSRISARRDTSSEESDLDSSYSNTIQARGPSHL